MNIIQSIIADLNAVMKRIETEIGGTHSTVTAAASGIKSAATSIAQHPLASAAPSTIVSPGMEAPEAADASSAAAAPANDGSEAADAPTADPVNSAAPTA